MMITFLPMTTTTPTFLNLFIPFGIATSSSFLLLLSLWLLILVPWVKRVARDARASFARTTRLQDEATRAWAQVISADRVIRAHHEELDAALRAYTQMRDRIEALEEHLIHAPTLSHEALLIRDGDIERISTRKQEVVQA